MFLREVGGQELTFVFDGTSFVDEQTRSAWSILGKGLSGELAGRELTPVVHGDHFWFDWAAFKPGTTVYRGAP